MKNEADFYEYSVSWDPDDEVFVARVAEFHSLAAHGKTPTKALDALRALVADVLVDLKKNKEAIPEPLNLRRYSGNLHLRMGPELHRRLAIEAERAKLSLNQLITQRLSSM